VENSDALALPLMMPLANRSLNLQILVFAPNRFVHLILSAAVQLIPSFRVIAVIAALFACPRLIGGLRLRVSKIAVNVCCPTDHGVELH
jgi:hypothetical protein